MNLTLRFVILIGGLLAAVAASTEAGLHAAGELDRALTRVVDDDMQRLLAITHARRGFRSLTVLERDYLLATTPSERDALDHKVSELAHELDEHLAAYERRMPAIDAEALAHIREARDRFLALDARVRAAAAVSGADALALSKQHASDPVSWEQEIGGLVRLSQARLDAQVAETHHVHAVAEERLVWVSLLAAAFAGGLGYAIFIGIRRNVAAVVDMNENLEGQVRARTESLAQRERALRLVLDSTGDALFEVSRDGRLTGASSAAAVRWFGAFEPGRSIADFLFPDDPAAATSFAVGFDQLSEDVLPWDLCHEQLPRRVTRARRHFELDCKRVLENEAFTKILVVAHDVTDTLHSEQREREAREQQTLIGKLLLDKQGFAQFVTDTEALLSSLSEGCAVDEARRDLHTLKGNVAIFGLQSLAERCHALEDRMAESGEPPTASSVAELDALWRTRLQSIEHFLNALGGRRFEVDLAEHARLIESLLQRSDCAEIVTMVELWSWPRTLERLTRLRGHAEHLAERLGRTVELAVEHNDLRVPSDYLERFWPTLIHVLRNAIDHGAEPSEQRLAQGKSVATRIVLSTRHEGSSFVIEVRDDGAGVDREALLHNARAKDPSLADDVSTETLMFAEGVSARSEDTHTSGRGVGLAAVRHACRAEGGTIEIETVRGKGTSFRFRFRQPMVKPGALVTQMERRWSFRPTMSVRPANSQTSSAPVMPRGVAVSSSPPLRG